MTGEFDEFFQAAVGRAPEAFEAAIAAEGLPARFTTPRGADAAAAAVLPWLFRRLVGAPESTPRRLVYVLPAHSLPEQVFARVGGWLGRLRELGLVADVGVHLVAGAVRDGGWLRHPERTAILVGSEDLLLSSALMRGFAASRRSAPVEYGLLHNDAHWVFAAAHRLGPGSATSVQLQHLRDELGTAAPTATSWMSTAEDPADSGDFIAGRPLPGGDVENQARTVVAAHVVGTQTAVILCSVARARALYAALRAAAPGRDVVLIHPYFRPGDRRTRLGELAESNRDRIIVATSALEVGVDFSPRTLLTEAGSESVGRDGPAETADPRWDQAGLLALFDTAVDSPDLDIAGWVGEPAEHTALVAWRDWESGEPSEEEEGPGRDELCPVPLSEVRRVLDGRAWLRDRLDGLWRRATAADLAPGVQMLLDARFGGYLPDEGWAPDSTAPVLVPARSSDPMMFACVEWVSLDQHLMETEDEARTLIDALPALPASQREAVILAARYHDLGKCHEAFQEMLRSGGGEPPDVLLAKSKAPYSTGRNPRPYFRHELVSALILAHGDHWHGDQRHGDQRHGDHIDHRLVTYLAAAHHGQVRISLPVRPDEAPAILGVLDGDRTPAITLSSGEVFPAQGLSTADFRPGAEGAPAEWTKQAQALRDRADLGPFRLAYLEALVRIADWRSSARHDGPVEAPVANPAERSPEAPTASPAVTAGEERTT